MKKIILVLAIFALASCDLLTPESLRDSDAVSYRVIGTSIIGVVLIDYATPTSGVVSLTSTLAVPFNSGTIAGYGQFVDIKPAVTIGIIATGCVEAQILVNAVVVEKKTGCGPVTFSVKH